MRDLQADLELCNKATVIKMALAEKERADKAESLARELAGALEVAMDLLVNVG